MAAASSVNTWRDDYSCWRRKKRKAVPDLKARVGFFFLLLEQASVPEVVFLSMGNCNTRILFMGTNLSARRNMHHTAAPAEEADYGFRGPLLRSSSSEESTFVLFENQTNSPIKLYWWEPHTPSLFPLLSPPFPSFVLYSYTLILIVLYCRLNYEGQKTAYRTLQPGRIHRQQTFVTHPWTFDNMDGDPESVVVDHKRVSESFIFLLLKGVCSGSHTNPLLLCADYFPERGGR